MQTLNAILVMNSGDQIDAWKVYSAHIEGDCTRRKMPNIVLNELGREV
jgi:hypothetical protein